VAKRALLQSRKRRAEVTQQFQILLFVLALRAFGLATLVSQDTERI
jgi:hypothetical protein